MQKPDFQPKMVGRDEELKDLVGFLEKTSEGKGNTIFISGEAGIGKTGLVNELKQVAQSKGFQILSGNCMHESLTPFMPIMEALRSGDMESLFAEEAPRVEAVYLVTNAGILIRDVVREETKLDSDVFASMFNTVTDFVNESLSKLTGDEEKGTLNSLGYQNYRILIESLGETNLVVIVSGRENEFLLNDMREILSKITKTFKKTLKEWGGDEKKVAGIEELLKPIITSGKYDGIYYGKEDPKARRNLLFKNVSMGLTRSAQTSPTLLCIEDLQWADPSSLALMHHIARNTKTSELFILSTYRPEDVAAEDGKGHPLVGTMQLMNREDLYEKMDLERLPEGSLTEFLSALLGDFDFSDKFTNRIYNETEGNPLFVIELVKYLVDEEVIKKINGTWKLAKPLEEGTIPSKVYNVISRRLNRVEMNDRKVLDYASIIGEAFDPTLLAFTLDIKRVQLLERLRYLEQTHRLIHPHNGNFKFDHAKIKEVLYSEIPEELGKEYHFTIADTLETLNKDNLDEVVGDLAFHYYRCKNKEKALFYLIKAANRAKKDFSNEEAIKFYNYALELEEEVRSRTEILENLGDTLGVIGDYEKTIEIYQSAMDSLTESRKKALIAVKAADAYVRMGNYNEGINHCSRAIDLVKGEGCKEEALAIDLIGRIHHERGEHDEALKHHKKSLEIWEKINDPGGTATTLSHLGIDYYLRGEFDKALDYHNKSLILRKEIGDLRGLAQILDYIGVIHNWSGQYQNALEYYRQSLAIAEKIDDPYSLAESYINIGTVHLRREEFEEAKDYLGKTHEMVKKVDIPWCTSVLYWLLGDLSRKQGEPKKALEYYKGAEELSHKLGFHMWLTYIYCSLAEMYYEQNELKNAINKCQQALDISNQIQFKESIAKSKKIFGMIFREQKAWEDSISNFQESVKLFEMIGMNHELAKSHYEFGRMWKAKGESDKAVEHLNKANNIFEELNLENESKKVKVELETL
ncbi:MAG: tetratricopeptide repeat protein [Thermoplasmata archaeon]|nr:MAG: tetratricopeptide repeat protein [Thermoplasmata archaeon]